MGNQRISRSLSLSWATAPPIRRTAPAPPVAAPFAALGSRSGGEVRVDPYYWLAKRDDPEVLRYLEAENEYADAVMEPLEPLEAEIYAEIKGRIKKDDASVPVRRGDHFYYSRFAGDAEYPIFARKRGSLDAPEELLLDANELARGHSYFSIAGVEESSNEKLLAFATDTVGRRIYTLRFKDLESGRMLADEIPGVDRQPGLGRGRQARSSTPSRIRRRCAGTASTVTSSAPTRRRMRWSTRRPIPSSTCSVGKTRSRRFLVIESEQTLSNEVRYLDATHPDGRVPRVSRA